MRVNLFVAFWTLVLELSCAAEAGIIGDQCDWSGSGLSSTSTSGEGGDGGSESERGVTPVYLRCRAGAVSWQYPRGALRLLVRPPLPASDTDFKLCVRVIRRPDPPDLFHDLHYNYTVPADRFPVRLFVEGKHKLIPLYAPDDGDPRELRCFRSRNGQAAVYAEAEPEEGPKRRVATLRYEAKPLERRHYDPATADCRPCSASELELAFCTSDLVSRGEIVGIEQRSDLDSTQLTVRLTKLIRATGGDADLLHSARASSPHLDQDQTYYRYDTENTVEQKSSTRHARGGGDKRRRAGRSLHAHVHVSLACGAAGGDGEFLVMARRRLGRYELVCAPRLHHWKELVDRRKADGNAYCVLQL